MQGERDLIEKENLSLKTSSRPHSLKIYVIAINCIWNGMAFCWWCCCWLMSSHPSFLPVNFQVRTQTVMFKREGQSRDGLSTEQTTNYTEASSSKSRPKQIPLFLRHKTFNRQDGHNISNAHQVIKFHSLLSWSSSSFPRVCMSVLHSFSFSSTQTCILLSS